MSNSHSSSTDPDGAAAAATTSDELAEVIEEVAAGAKLLPAAPPPPAAAATEQQQQPQQQHAHGVAPPRCLVCYTDLHKTAVAVAPCHHDEICALCHLRLRHLHGDRQCPICKAANEQIVVVDKYSAKTTKVFEDYPIWGDDLGADYAYRADAGMFFPRRYYEAVVQPLFGYHCLVKHCPQSLLLTSSEGEGGGSAKNAAAATVQDSSETTAPPPQPLTSLRQLQDHLRTAHRLALCQLCVDHQRDFVAKLPRYSPAGLQKHLANPHGGHPVCEFCRPTRFYDVTALHQHLAKEHYKCHVCEQQLELPNQYFASYRSLERHFDARHFLCHDVQCLTARFVVFGSELDLRHHERHVHGSSSAGGGSVQLEFRVRRGGGNSGGGAADGPPPSESDFNYALDGQAFVPAALPPPPRRTSATSGGAAAAAAATDQLHPQHVQRTHELMEEAARLRQQQGEQASFPALAGPSSSNDNTTATTTASNSRLTVGWTGDATLQRVRRRPAGAVTQEDFPSLAPAPKPRSGAAAKLGGKKKAAAPLSAGWSSSSSAVAQPSNTIRSYTASTVSSTPSNSVSTLTPLGRSSAAAVVRPNSSSNNNAANLAAGNFPSLGGSSNAPARYTAANALAKKVASGGNSKNAQQSLQADNFPALGGGSKKKPVPAALRKKPPPEWNSAADFPPALVAAPTAAVSVQDMKAALGAAPYKKLKALTRDFAAADLAPDAYVDHAAALFGQGYADPDFWTLVPALLQSCPNARDNDAALRYMDNLQRLQNGARNAEHQHATMTATAHPTGRMVQPATHRSARAPKMGGRKAPNNAWGSGAAASVTRAKAAPGSVAAAAARVQPTNTTATAYMAQQSKQEKWQQANNATANTNKNTKKGKQKNELRSLAFGAS